MSVIAKWAMQAVTVFFFAWLATVASSWSSSTVRGTGSDRLAELTQRPVVVDSFANKSAASQTAVTGLSGDGE
ncbi:hypothetical protein ACCD10_08870 [Pseudomonas sp. Pseusp122]|uniref:hypothetical protein n=1 Tax=unclassified Pseudomonas TaxID=196821 RepID=UPI0039A46B78